jgi:hypothetical protein
VWPWWRLTKGSPVQAEADRDVILVLPTSHRNHTAAAGADAVGRAEIAESVNVARRGALGIARCAFISLGLESHDSPFLRGQYFTHDA